MSLRSLMPMLLETVLYMHHEGLNVAAIHLRANYTLEGNKEQIPVFLRQLERFWAVELKHHHHSLMAIWYYICWSVGLPDRMSGLACRELDRLFMYHLLLCGRAVEEDGNPRLKTVASEKSKYLGFCRFFPKILGGSCSS